MTAPATPALLAGVVRVVDGAPVVGAEVTHVALSTQAELPIDRRPDLRVEHLPGPIGARELGRHVTGRLLAGLIAASVVVAGCTAPPPTVVARDDPDATVCVPRSADDTAQIAVSFVENTGTGVAVLSDFELINPTSDALTILGAYLAVPEDELVTGDSFDQDAASPELPLDPGATVLLVYGLALTSDEPAHADGVSFTYTVDGRTHRGRTNLPVQVETTLTGCAEWGASLNQD